MNIIVDVAVVHAWSVLWVDKIYIIIGLVVNIRIFYRHERCVHIFAIQWRACSIIVVVIVVEINKPV